MASAPMRRMPSASPPHRTVWPALAFCFAVAGSAARADTVPNVLLVTLDTTRADRLGCYGDADAITPALDALAAHGVTFEQAFTQCPLTLPAHTTILTGLEPPEHGVRTNGRAALADGVPTLAAVLHDHGYATGAFVAAYVVNHRFGLDRGFDVYDDDLSRPSPQDFVEELSVSRSGDQVLARATAWMDTVGTRPFFAWVHFYDAHYPYQRHPELAGTRLADAVSYDGDVAFMDLQVRGLLDYLDAHALRARTLVVAVGDHGEGLNEHGDAEHGYLLNIEVLHVPMIASRPGTVPEGRRVPAVVSLTDVFPTILEHVGVPQPVPVRGRSLAAALRGESIASLSSYAETDLPLAQFGWSPLRSLMTPEWHYVRTTRPELYARATDGAERANLADFHAADIARLEVELRAREQTFLGHGVAPTPLALDPDARRRLAALGYVDAETGPQAGDASAPRRDIKDMLPVKHLATLLRRRMADGADAEEIERRVRELVARSPETASFQSHLGALLVARGRLDEAAAALDEALRLQPDLPEALIALGDLRLRQNQADAATALYQRALAQDPDVPEAHRGLGRALATAGQWDAALDHYREALRLQPAAEASLRNDMGSVLAESGDLAAAAEQYQLAVAKDAALPSPRFNLGRLRERQGDARAAEAAYREVLRRTPGFADASNALALLLIARDDPDAARRTLVASLRLKPGVAATHHNLATVLVRQHRIPKAIEHEARALALEPDQAEHLNGMAWLLATAQATRRRDGARAISLAERACELTRRQDARFLNTLAAAFASADRPVDAARTARAAGEVARAAGQTALAEESEALARAYAGGKSSPDTPSEAARSAP